MIYAENFRKMLPHLPVFILSVKDVHLLSSYLEAHPFGQFYKPQKISYITVFFQFTRKTYGFKTLVFINDVHVVISGKGFHDFR